MEFMKIITDDYDRYARLYPALILIAPISIAILPILIVNYDIFKILMSLFLVCGMPFLLGQMIRDMGKHKEKELFNKWGGMPSSAVFRYRDEAIDQITKCHYHKILANFVPDTKLFTPEEENEHPQDADNVYLAWSNFLRVQTRDTKKFNLIHAENINYGFRRNIFGCRIIGIIISLLSNLSFIFYIYITSKSSNIDYITIISIISNFFILQLWIFYFTDKWVRIPANAYAMRLAESVSILENLKYT
jgi:hypothetical protein